MPVDQDLCHINHVEGSPRHHLPPSTQEGRKVAPASMARSAPDAHVLPTGNYVIRGGELCDRQPLSTGAFMIVDS